MSYQWNQTKALINLKKHKIDFVDAIAVLKDDYALIREDEFVDEEQRFMAIGMDLFARVTAVVYTYREDDIRIISARPATPKERKAYESKRA